MLVSLASHAHQAPHIGLPQSAPVTRHRKVNAAPTGEAARALIEDVDYFCVGPCWPTPTKPGRPAPGLDLVRAVASMGADKPWFAIGGIDEKRLGEVLAAGARRGVVVRATTEAADPGAAARRLRAALDQTS